MQASPAVCFLVCILYNTQKQKNSEKQGRPGLIHHVSGCKVDIGGGANIQICTT